MSMNRNDNSHIVEMYQPIRRYTPTKETLAILVIVLVTETLQIFKQLYSGHLKSNHEIHIVLAGASSRRL